MQLRKSIFRTPDKIPENPPTFKLQRCRLYGAFPASPKSVIIRKNLWSGTYV
ncbi:Uncharacterized protein dnm_072010 [Desulfonema magnum]|uniref:Uncharacterized protein n=1 Tax=Desulfonema magnum TaxID=45655 RepID=A0A975GRK0_9BACT|nr:Uncharacterized protein dnm_072010 [Desulfonema magnum]